MSRLRPLMFALLCVAPAVCAQPAQAAEQPQPARPAETAAPADRAQPSRAPARIAPTPPGFHWGVATAGFQSEGGAPDSNWRRYVDSGTGPNSGRPSSGKPDGEKKASGRGEVEDPYGNAVDFRHRYPEDIARAKAMGVNTFRFSIEWPRVQPRPGVWDERELAYYDDVFRRVEQAGMTPMPTLTHFTHPGWVVDRGAWTNPTTIDDWLTFTRAITQRYSGHHALWITFNEPTAYENHEKRNGGIDALHTGEMMDNLAAAHRRGYDVIHRADPTARVSSNLSYMPPPLQGFGDAEFVDKVKDELDFVGIDYYYGASVDDLSAVHAANDEFWKVAPQPDGIYYALEDYQRKFPNLPMYVVENGMPSDGAKPRPDGYTRSDHLRDHLYWMQRAMAEGVNVMGYNYWSLTDNYEWGSYRARFGLYTVDALGDPSLTRRPTGAVDTFRNAIANGGVSAGYVPKRRPAWCAFADPRTCLRPVPVDGDHHA